MEKVSVKTKKTPNWKFWTLIVAVAALAIGLVLSLCLCGVKTWLISILFPVILSGMVGVGVSLWFTIKIEQDNLYRDLFLELHELFDYSFSLFRNLDSTMFSMTIPLSSKKRIMINDIARKPRLFYIHEYYREFYEFFEQKQKELMDFVGKIEPGKIPLYLPKEDTHFSEYHFIVTEIVDETLKLQEQISQDFKKIPKGPIPDQLIHRMNSTPDKKRR